MSTIADRTAHRDVVAPSALARTGLPRLETQTLAGPEWDRIAAGFDQICQEQLHAFAAIRWPGVAMEPVLFSHNGQVVGGVLMMIQRLPLGLAEIAICKWGPMLADSSAADALLIHGAMIESLVAEYADRRGMLLSVLPHASTEPVNAPYVAWRARGFRRGSVLAYPNRYLVNLRLSDAEQRKSFGQTWRRQLNKAEKAGLLFEHAAPGRLDEFKQLYSAMTERKQFPDHSAYETLDRLMAMDEPVRPELFFVRHEGAIVAGALIFKAGDHAVYLYGATNEEALPLRAGYFMHARIISWLRDHTHASWYDLGGTDGFQGLHQFKKGMVGDEGVVRPVPPVANYASRPLAYALGSGAFAARDGFNLLRRKIDQLLPGKSKPDQAPHVPEDYLR